MTTLNLECQVMKKPQVRSEENFLPKRKYWTNGFVDYEMIWFDKLSGDYSILYFLSRWG